MHIEEGNLHVKGLWTYYLQNSQDLVDCLNELIQTHYLGKKPKN